MGILYDIWSGMKHKTLSEKTMKNRPKMTTFDVNPFTNQPYKKQKESGINKKVK